MMGSTRMARCAGVQDATNATREPRLNTLRFTVAREIEPVSKVIVGAHLREACVLPPPLRVIPRRQSPLGDLRWMGVPDGNKLLRLRIRKRAQEQTFDHATNRGVCADA